MLGFGASFPTDRIDIAFFCIISLYYCVGLCCRGSDFDEEEKLNVSLDVLGFDLKNS